ncbi:hypothetical protein F6Y05_37090 [Bacillus megaterium]|nr:hypothetical protein [Priestia megaterium]
MTENFKGLPNFVKQELEKLKPYEGKELQFPLGDNAFNFWELDAKSVFPHTPELQKLLIN